jgi:iron complex transport system substrate-binding protein
MRWRLTFVLALALFNGAACAAGLPRIVSMNVCSDQLLLSLADPGQILGLSRFSRDAWQSFAADEAWRFPILSGGAEDVLEAKPDIVVASLFDKRSTRELLKANGLHLVEFSVPRTLDEVKQQISEMGDVVQHPDRAALAIARLDAAIARARQAVTDHHYRVLPLSRRGWVSGSESLVSSLLTETGLLNPAADLGVHHITRIPADADCSSARHIRRPSAPWPRIVALLLADSGDGVTALVVMGGEHHRLVGQFLTTG